jgi:hypothetical protein
MSLCGKQHYYRIIGTRMDQFGVHMNFLWFIQVLAFIFTWTIHFLNDFIILFLLWTAPWIALRRCDGSTRLWLRQRRDFPPPNPMARPTGIGAQGLEHSNISPRAFPRSHNTGKAQIRRRRQSLFFLCSCPWRRYEMREGCGTVLYSAKEPRRGGGAVTPVKIM